MERAGNGRLWSHRDPAPLEVDDNGPPSDADGDNNDDEEECNDGGGSGCQGSGEDPGEDEGWGRPRPRFYDLRPSSPDSMDAGGGEPSREPPRRDRSCQDRNNRRFAQADHFPALLQRAILASRAKQGRSITMGSIFNDSTCVCTAIKEHKLSFHGMPLLSRPLDNDENKAVTIVGIPLVEMLRFGLADICEE